MTYRNPNRTAAASAVAAAVVVAASFVSVPAARAQDRDSGAGSPFVSPLGAFSLTDTPGVRPSARALLAAERGEDLLRGNGTAFGYLLTRGNLVPGSESVTVDGVRLRAGSGYTLNAGGGSLTFARPVRAEQAIVVSYRYLPTAPSGIAPTPSPLGFPLLSVRGVGGTKHGLTFALTRTGAGGADGGGVATTLLGLRSESAPGAAGLSGLLYLTGNGPGSTARSLTAAAGGVPNVPEAARGHLIDQRLAVGTERTGLSLSYQDVSSTFSAFPALRGAKVAPDDVLARLEKEKGIRRVGVAGNLGLGGPANLRYTHSDLSASGGAGITRQGLSLQGNGLSLSANLLRIDPKFNRFKDLADADRETLEKWGAGQRLDLAGQWKLGSTLRFEGNLLDHDQKGKGNRKDTHSLLTLTPGGGWTLRALQESAATSAGATPSGSKTDRRSTREYEISSNPAAATAFSFLSRTVAADTGDSTRSNETSESLTRLAAATLLGTKTRGVALKGLRETTDRRNLRRADDGAVSLDGFKAETTSYGFETLGAGLLRLNVQNKATATRDRAGLVLRRDASRAWDGALRVARDATASFSLRSDTTEVRAPAAAETGPGSAPRSFSAREQQSWDLQLGRGYTFRHSLDRTRQGGIGIGGGEAGRGMREVRRNELMRFATDSALRWFAAAERHASFADDPATSEEGEKWNAGVLLGGLSLKSDGYEVRRTGGTGLKREKNLNLTGSLALPGAATLRYVAFDRTDIDPKTKQPRNEIGSEWEAQAGAGAYQIVLKQIAYDNRRDVEIGTARQEIAITPRKALKRLGPFRDANLSLAYGIERSKEKAEGRNRKVSYKAGLGAHRVAFGYGETQRAEGPGSVSRSFQWDSSPDRPLRFGALYRVQTRHGEPALWGRAWSAEYQVAPECRLAYRFGLNPEQPDGTTRPLRTESASFAGKLGRDGKIAAEYQTTLDLAKNTAARGASFSLLSPTSDVTAYEAQFSRQSTRTPDGGWTDLQSYALKYLHQSGEETRVEIAARWIRREGTVARQNKEPDEIQANVDVKLGL